MDRRDFLKKTALGVAAVAATSLLEHPVVAKANELINLKTNNNMKKIMIIDGGPRKNMNTAAMVQSFAEGAREAVGRRISTVAARPAGGWQKISRNFGNSFQNSGRRNMENSAFFCKNIQNVPK